MLIAFDYTELWFRLPSLPRDYSEDVKTVKPESWEKYKRAYEAWEDAHTELLREAGFSK